MRWVEVVVVVLLMLTALHALLTVALIRRIGQLAAGGSTAPTGPRPASALGSLDARTLDGSPAEGVALDGALVAVLSTACSSCAEAAARLEAAARRGSLRGRVVALVVGTGEVPDYARALAGVADVYLLDDLDHPFLTANGIRLYPYFIRADEEGLVRAAGGDLSEVVDVAAERT